MHFKVQSLLISFLVFFFNGKIWEFLFLYVFTRQVIVTVSVLSSRWTATINWHDLSLPFSNRFSNNSSITVDILKPPSFLHPVEYLLDQQIIHCWVKVQLKYFTDPIDCVSDVCHLAWIIRENRHLLKAVRDAQCSNGIPLIDLQLPDNYADCPVSIKNNSTESSKEMYSFNRY